MQEAMFPHPPPAYKGQQSVSLFSQIRPQPQAPDSHNKNMGAGGGGSLSSAQKYIAKDILFFLEDIQSSKWKYLSHK